MTQFPAKSCKVKHKENVRGPKLWPRWRKDAGIQQCIYVFWSHMNRACGLIRGFLSGGHSVDTWIVHPLYTVQSEWSECLVGCE